jgi:hypothetical protein
VNCIRIGYGHVAEWHENKLTEQGVTTIGIIDLDEKKRKLALEAGFQAFSSYEEAFKFEDNFFTISRSFVMVSIVVSPRFPN